MHQPAARWSLGTTSEGNREKGGGKKGQEQRHTGERKRCFLGEIYILIGYSLARVLFPIREGKAAERSK